MLWYINGILYWKGRRKTIFVIDSRNDEENKKREG